MKTIMKLTTMSTVLLLMLITNIPILPVDMVSDAEAIFGVRRRTAIVAYSAGKAAASSSAASQQQAAAASATSQQQAAVAHQQAATAQQQAAVAQQQLAASQVTSGVPIGSVVQSLPTGCIAVNVGGSQYQDCDGSFYKAAFQGNKLIYVVVQKPL